MLKDFNLEKYTALFGLSWKHGLTNYKNLIGLSIFLITCLLIFSHLWQIASARMGGQDLSPDHLLWYIAFNEWVLISIPEIRLDMEDDLRKGRLAYQLPRPISYLGAKFAEGLGELTLNMVVLGIVSLLFTWLWVGSLPFSLPTLGIAIVLGFLAGILALLFHMLVGLSAFWLHDISPFYWIWEKLLFVFGGLILPLSVYPEWMQLIAAWTPFPLILGQRSALALNFDFTLVYSVGMGLIIWILCAGITLRLLYYKGLKILNVEGG